MPLTASQSVLLVAYGCLRSCWPARWPHSSLKILNLFDDCLGQSGKLNVRTLFIHDRNMIQRVSEIGQERQTVKILAFGQVVHRVKDHPRPLHEWHAKNNVDRDVAAHCDQER